VVRGFASRRVRPACACNAGFGAGLLTGTTQGAIATTETPSPFGELESLVATENSNPLYTLDVSARDALDG